MRILVYHAGALGDFVTLLPCFRLLRAAFPRACVSLLGRPAFGELALSRGLVDRVLDASSARAAALFARGGAERAGELLGEQERALLFSDSEALAASCRRLGAAVSLHRPFPDRKVSAYRFHLASVAAALGLAGSPPAREALALPLLGPRPPGVQPVAVIHPASGGRAKVWPVERYGPVAEGLRRRGMRVAWSTGPADEAWAEAIGRLALPGDERLVDLSPAALLGRLAAASLYVGVDSGVSHLAAASGCPSVLLFGATSRAVWRPPGGHVRLLPERRCCPALAPQTRSCLTPPRGERCPHKEDGVPRCLLAVSAERLLRAASELAPPGAAR